MSGSRRLDQRDKEKKEKGAETERRRFDMDETFAADLI